MMDGLMDDWVKQWIDVQISWCNSLHPNHCLFTGVVWNTSARASC